jgi:antitoxin MazE
MATKTRIVRIGNSRGIRVPKAILEQAQLPAEVELHARPGRLVVLGVKRPRDGWAAAARAMRQRGEDAEGCPVRGGSRSACAPDLSNLSDLLALKIRELRTCLLFPEAETVVAFRRLPPDASRA